MTYKIKMSGQFLYDNIIFYYEELNTIKVLYNTVFLTKNEELKEYWKYASEFGYNTSYDKFDYQYTFSKTNIIPENTKVDSFATVHHNAYVEFEFPDEESAFYFKLKFC